jgi:hypothetical protein
MSIETQALIAYSVSLALVILMKCLCFILGYLTIRLGYQLIALGVRGEFKFAASLGGARADLVSLSPGLLFVFLGVLLIGYAMYLEKPVTVTLPRSLESHSIPALPQPSVPNELPSEKKE